MQGPQVYLHNVLKLSYVKILRSLSLPAWEVLVHSLLETPAKRGQLTDTNLVAVKWALNNSFWAGKKSDITGNKD